MKSRDRITGTLTGKPTDRTPYIAGMGIWGETLRRWRSEGLDTDDWTSKFNFDAGLMSVSDFSGDVRLGLMPWFDGIIIEEKERSVIRRDIYGIVREDLRYEFGESLSNFLEYPVKTRDDWERIREERLNPLTPRLPDNIEEIAERYNKGDRTIYLGEYPYGLFGTCRDLMGVENFLIACAEEPELISDMMNHLTDLWLAVYAQVVKYFKIDIVHMWEDMSGKQGSLISPAMVRAFMLPNYRRIRSFCDNNGIEIFSADTDGNVTELVPLFMEGGVNFIYPFEVAAGCDVREYRRKYPELAIMGGIDKRELTKSKKEIDGVMKMVAEMIPFGRFIPAVDHHVHPEISWENFKYYAESLAEVLGVKRGDTE